MCAGEMRGKGDVMFDDVIADVQCMQISDCGSSEPALRSCPALSVCPAPALYPSVPALAVCELEIASNSTLSPLSVYQFRLKLSVAKASPLHSSNTATDPLAGSISQVTMPKLSSRALFFFFQSEPQHEPYFSS